jgi:phage N-6-adenine-methyltransferase|tara:strand:- start:182 stop:619 length:438 start_codon:yes stop_codon:yes gene_type:complete
MTDIVTRAPGMFTSLSGEWETPDALFKELDREFHFTLDVCATPGNTKTPEFLNAEDLWSSLAQPWRGICWMNPPYGHHIGEWIGHAYRSAQEGATVVCLLPSRTDTAWWHDYCMKGEIRFIRGRLYFNDGEGRAPFPSAVVVFRP